MVKMLNSTLDQADVEGEVVEVQNGTSRNEVRCSCLSFDN